MSSTGKKIYKVRLEPDERKHLKEILDSGKGSKERRRRAHILLLADESRPDGGLSDGAIAEVLEIGTATIERVRKQGRDGGAGGGTGTQGPGEPQEASARRRG